MFCQEVPIIVLIENSSADLVAAFVAVESSEFRVDFSTKSSYGNISLEKKLMSVHIYVFCCKRILNWETQFLSVSMCSFFPSA